MTNVRTWILPALTFLVVLVVVAFGWTGYYGSDDMSYATGGLGWLNHFSYVGNSHWTLRHTIVVPMAILFGTFGVSELTLVLPVTIYFFALLALVFVMMQRYFDRVTACIAVFVLGTLPLMSLASTTVVPDFAEVFFCLLSLSLFFEATRFEERRNLLLVLAGIAAGFGWLTRETVVFFLLTYGVLFIVGFGVPRRLYLLMAAGFLGVVGIEFAYFAITTGNPLYRINSDLSTHLGVDVIHGGKPAEGLERAIGKVEGEMYGPLSRTGSLSVNRFLDPILVILATHEFMFFYYLAVPAAAWAAGKRLFSGTQGAFLGIFGVAGLVWFGCVYLQIGMTLLPRYYMLPTVVLVMVFSAWLRTFLWPRSRILTAAALVFLFSTNLAGIYIDNKNPVFGERSLVEFLRQTDEVVHTDPETARRGGFLFDIAGVQDRVVAGPPEHGKLYFYNPAYVKFALMSFDRQAKQREMAPYLPQEGWPVVWHKEPERRWIGDVIDSLGLTSILPKEIYRRLVQPHFAVTVYRP
jgi:hypothetical protein